MLQLNIARSRARMEALINDTAIRDLDILLIQEPLAQQHMTQVQHREWTCYRPTYDEEVRRRSLIYINKRFSASTHRQTPCSSPDVTAVQLQTPTQAILIFSVYIPPVEKIAAVDEERLHNTTQAIQGTIQAHSVNPEAGPDIIMGGDFNRQHPMWGGDNINRKRITEASSLLMFIRDHNLHSLLSRGTPTFWSVNKPGTRSTLDLTLSNIPTQLLKCQIYPESYGSDHRATYSEWDLSPRRREQAPARRLYQNTDWEEVGKRVQWS